MRGYSNVFTHFFIKIVQTICYYGLFFLILHAKFVLYRIIYRMRQLKITKSITNRESASLDKYLQEIGREDLITV